MSDPEPFAALLRRFTAAVEAGDRAAFAACFSADAVYHDYIYGAHRGHDGIAGMLGLFHRDARDYRWEMLDPVCDGRIGYARWLFSYTVTMPEFAGRRVVIDGISRFLLQDGLVAEYRESINGGVALVQLGLAPERIAKRLQRWTDELLQRADVQRHLQPRP